MLSIIVPVYNARENDFRKCLDSILIQIIKDMQVIIIDDCSTDSGFLKVLKGFRL